MLYQKTNQKNIILANSLLLALVVCCGTTLAQSLPRVFAFDPAQLNRTKARIAEQDKSLRPAFERLRREAAQALLEGPFTVTAKQRLPPSGDKHDYLTLAPYWWPDPTKPDGLPYIRRDGELNPESKRDTDNPRLNAMAAAVETLALAFYFTGEEKYAV